jgi:hypothetical protein
MVGGEVRATVAASTGSSRRATSCASAPMVESLLRTPISPAQWIAATLSAKRIAR